MISLVEPVKRKMQIVENTEKIISIWCKYCKKEVMTKSLENHLFKEHKISLDRYNKLFGN